MLQSGDRNLLLTLLWGSNYTFLCVKSNLIFVFGDHQRSCMLTGAVDVLFARETRINPRTAVFYPVLSDARN